jgi:hypothetical protein
MGDISDIYDKAPKPRKRCENCANGSMFSDPIKGTWQDVYVCRLDGGNKDYRVTCENWERRA